MASQLSETLWKNRNLLIYELTEKQEEELMFRYTKGLTRELIFAVDMMTYVMETSNELFQNSIYPNCSDRPLPSDFDDVIKDCVKLTLRKYKSRILKVIEQNINLERPSETEFKCFAWASALKLEKLEYSEYAYLIFCVFLSHMCLYAYLHGMDKAPMFGVMLMCRTYSNFVPANPWQALKTAAREMVDEPMVTSRSPGHERDLARKAYRA